MRNVNDIVASCLSAIVDDYTELWVIAKRVAEHHPYISLAENRQITKAVIQDLIENHGVKVIDETTEKPSEMTSSEVLREIDKIYNRTGRLPNIGDGLWFG